MIDKVNNANAYQSKNALSPIRTFNSQQISFEAVLNQKLNEKTQELQLSKHAKERVVERGIDIDTRLMSTLNEAAQTARQKGATNTVMIGQDAAFVVNIPNGIIVTAISAEELKKAEGSFTSSNFVKKTTGVDNVCERAAVLGSQGQLIVKKQALNGVTAAIAVRTEKFLFG